MIRILISTIGSFDEAGRIARLLVEERLAACVNLVPGLTSVYRWNGAVQSDPETLMIIKTAADGIEPLIDRLRQVHPYEVPEILVIPVEAGLEAYLQWVVQESGCAGR